MTSRPLRIGIVAGETSGDVLGAGLIKRLKAMYPDAIIEGIGGAQMQAQGCRSLFEMERLSVMGLFEVVKHLRELLAIRKALVEYFTANPPDVFIGVDAPDFNLGLELKLKQAGIKTVQYVSPSVWAWRQKRIVKIAKATDLVLSLLPFEKAFYDQYQVPCRFVGHTLADAIPLEPDIQGARQQLGLGQDDKVLAVLPGSRGGEVGRMLPPFLDAIAELNHRYPDLKVVMPAANEARRLQIEQMLENFPTVRNIQVVDGHSREVMTAADVILLASGTATLEAMLCKKPMVVCYKFNWLTYQLGKRLVKLPYFSLPNLLARQPLVPELLQSEVKGPTIAKALLPLLEKGSPKLVKRFSDLHQSIRLGADDSAAEAVLELIQSS